MLQYLDQESNLVWTFGGSYAIRYTIETYQYPDLESNQDQGLRRALCDPLHHRDDTTRADDWICTSIDAVYKTAASLFGHVGNKQECEDSNPVGGFGDRFLSQEDTPVSAPGLADRGPLA